MAYALVIWQLPFGVFSASVTTVLFPRLSRQAARGEKHDIVATLSYGMRFLILLLLPSAVFYLVMGHDIVRVIYQRGEFTAADTTATARVLFGYTLGLFSAGAFSFLQRFFYAVKDYKTPFFIALSITAIDVALSLWLKQTYLRVAGLAVANSVAFSLGLGLMIVFSRKKLGALDGRRIASDLLRVLASLAPAALILWVYGSWAGPLAENSAFPVRAALLIGGFLAFVLVTCILYYVFGVEIVRKTVNRRFRPHG